MAKGKPKSPKTKKAGGGGAPGKPSKVSFKAKPKKKKAPAPTEPPPPPRLKQHYAELARKKLQEKYSYRSPLAIPRITKLVVSMGIGDAHESPRKLEALLDDLEIISGQRPQVTQARISVANFKLRQGMPVGLRVTLRRTRMWEFLDRLLSLAIPRLRDFRGLNPKSFDGRGNYGFGLPDQLVFPEIKIDDVDHSHGMNIAVCTTAQTDDEARDLLQFVGFPFRDLEVQLLGKES